MHPLRPNRLTKKIGLVLIGSSMILSGCGHHHEEVPADAVTVIDPTPSFWYFHSGGGGVYHHYVPHPYPVTVGGSSSFVSRSGTISGFKSSASVSSVRGGFGSMGHSATAGA